ncbi:MAG: STAS domain-containing protein [Nannocystaceae bacterium]
MPVAANVLAVPVIGRYSRKRSLYLTEALTFGVTKHQARAVILDLTGLREIDEDTAATIQRLVAMIKLLGAHTVLTGVSAAVAQTLVRLEIDLVAQDVLIRPTMRAGIALALQLVKRRRDRDR